jgi:hypothetical protein
VTRTKTPTQAKRGETISLVRYIHKADGWEPELITGKYNARSDDEWQLTVDGTLTSFPRDEWELCRP